VVPEDGRIEGIVLKDRESPYRDGSRAHEREASRFDRR